MTLNTRTDISKVRKENFSSSRPTGLFIIPLNKKTLKLFMFRGKIFKKRKIDG